MEQVFLHMKRIKTDRQNRLGEKRLENYMIISEGPSEEFIPGQAIKTWYGKKKKKKSNKLEVRHQINIWQRWHKQTLEQ